MTNSVNIDKIREVIERMERAPMAIRYLTGEWIEMLESALPPQPEPGELWEFDVEHSETLGFILDDGTVVHEFGGRIAPIYPPIRRLYPPADHPAP